MIHAAVFYSTINKVCLVHPFLSFADIALTHEYSPVYIPSTVAGAIEAYDLADLMAVFCPHKLLIINPLLGNETMADVKRAGENLAFPVGVYSQYGRSENFSFICRKEKQQVFKDILKWLNR